MNKIDLTGIWNLRMEGEKITYESNLPGDICSSLIRHNRIPHPYKYRNELEVQWVGRKNWIYSRNFIIPKFFLEGDKYFIHLDRVDTIATIKINDRETGKCNNSFKGYNFQLTNLVPGNNDITIEIHSPEKKAIKCAEDLEYSVPFMEYPVQSPHRNLIRKTQCHSGWDWGPSIMTGGVYGSVFIYSVQNFQITNITTRQFRTGENWELEVDADLYAYEPCTETFTYKFYKTVEKKSINLVQGQNTVKHTISCSVIISISLNPIFF